MEGSVQVAVVGSEPVGARLTVKLVVADEVFEEGLIVSVAVVGVVTVMVATDGALHV